MHGVRSANSFRFHEPFQRRLYQSHRRPDTVCIDHNITRLAIDHALAKRLADGLAGVAGLQVEVPRTYIVFVDLVDNGGGTKARSAELIPYLKSRGVLATGLYWLRFVVHMDVDAASIDLAVQAIQRYWEKRTNHGSLAAEP